MANSNTKFLWSLKVLCCLFCLQAGYFFNGASWNQNARLNVIFSFVEPGPDQYTFKINRFIPEPAKNINTGDWSFYGGDYYSNKAPGTALLGIPFYFLLYHFESLLGLDVAEPRLALFNSYLLNLWVSVLPATLGIFFFALLLHQHGANEWLSLTITIALAFGTMYLPYATQLWGHVTAAAFVVVATYFLTSKQKSNGLIAGFCMGIAVLTDFLAVVPAVLSIVYCAQTSLRCSIRYVCAGFICLCFLLGYNWLCFGSPFHLPTDFMNPAFKDESGALGMFGTLSLSALWGLTFSLQKGVFLMMPILFFSVTGYAYWIRKTRTDLLLIYSLGVVLTLLAVNISFNGWHGGATIAARYQIIAIPFWLLALKELRLSSIVWKFVLFVSCLNMFAITAFGVLAPDTHPNPLYGGAYPFIARAVTGSDLGADLPMTPLGSLTPMPLPIRLQSLSNDREGFVSATAWNLGERAGLSEGQSLLPPLILLLVSLLFVVKLGVGRDDFEGSVCG